MKDWTDKTVICQDPCILNGRAFLQMGGEYEVMEDRAGFLLIKAYMRLPAPVHRVDGWWRKDRFELREGGVNASS